MKTLFPVFLSHVQRLTEDGSPYLRSGRRAGVPPAQLLRYGGIAAEWRRQINTGAGHSHGESVLDGLPAEVVMKKIHVC